MVSDLYSYMVGGAVTPRDLAVRVTLIVDQIGKSSKICEVNKIMYVVLVGTARTFYMQPACREVFIKSRKFSMDPVVNLVESHCPRFRSLRICADLQDFCRSLQICADLQDFCRSLQICADSKKNDLIRNTLKTKQRCQTNNKSV